jgi:hypothetical protein
VARLPAAARASSALVEMLRFLMRSSRTATDLAVSLPVVAGEEATFAAGILEEILAVFVEKREGGIRVKKEESFLFFL